MCSVLLNCSITFVTAPLRVIASSSSCRRAKGQRRGSRDRHFKKCQRRGAAITVRKFALTYNNKRDSLFSRVNQVVRISTINRNLPECVTLPPSILSVRLVFQMSLLYLCVLAAVLFGLCGGGRVSNGARFSSSCNDRSEIHVCAVDTADEPDEAAHVGDKDEREEALRGSSTSCRPAPASDSPHSVFSSSFFVLCAMNDAKRPRSGHDALRLLRQVRGCLVHRS